MAFRIVENLQAECDGCGELGPASERSMLPVALAMNGWEFDSHTMRVMCPSCQALPHGHGDARSARTKKRAKP